MGDVVDFALGCLFLLFFVMLASCYLLSPRGFCSGVSRAVHMAEQVLKLYDAVYITEDVIHNKVFMKELEQRGMTKVDSIEDVPDNAVVMFSAHGVPPQVVERAEQKGLTVVDATCPTVKSIQKEVEKAAEAGKKIIIIGNRSHAEIIALLGYAGVKSAFVVGNEMDVDLLPDFSKDDVVYFTQTTLDCLATDAIVKKIKEKVPHIESSTQDNICYATKERQDVVRRLVDLVIVVGSPHSSNAKRLSEVALSGGAKKSVLVDSKDELTDEIFEEVSTAAITSAASTPEVLVREVVDFLESKYGIAIEEFKLQDDTDEKG